MGDAARDGKTLDRLMARNLGAKHVWVLGTDDAAEALGALPGPCRHVCALGGAPVACVDVRVVARDAHEAGELVVCDNTIATSYGCAAVRLGADLATEALAHALGPAGERLVAVGVSKTFLARHRPWAEYVDGLAVRAPEVTEGLLDAYGAWDAERKRQNDAALAIAEYLVCHPRVGHVWYPGLLRDQRDSSRWDEANREAPNVLLGGFGAVVDFSLGEDAGILRSKGCAPVANIGNNLYRIVATSEDAYVQARLIEQELRS